MMRAGKGGNGGKVNQQQVVNQTGEANAGAVVYLPTAVHGTFRMTSISADLAIKHELIAIIFPIYMRLCVAWCICSTIPA